MESKPAWKEREALAWVFTFVMIVALNAHYGAAAGMACLGLGALTGGFAVARGLSKINGGGA